jgi:hypothetical protein
MNKQELESDIRRSWDALQAVLQRLSDAQMTGLRDAEGWTIKDHLIHITVWERSVVFFLQHQPRHLGLGVDESVYSRGPVDAINAAVYQQSKNLSLDEALAQFREVHRQLMELFQSLTDADLFRPYRDYLPNEPGEGEARLTYTVIRNNTADHFAEHQGWIELLAGAAS